MTSTRSNEVENQSEEISSGKAAILEPSDRNQIPVIPRKKRTHRTGKKYKNKMKRSNRNYK